MVYTVINTLSPNVQRKNHHPSHGGNAPLCVSVPHWWPNESDFKPNLTQSDGGAEKKLVSLGQFGTVTLVYIQSERNCWALLSSSLKHVIHPSINLRHSYRSHCRAATCVSVWTSSARHGSTQMRQQRAHWARVPGATHGAQGAQLWEPSLYPVIQQAETWAAQERAADGRQDPAFLWEFDWG